MPLWRLKIVAEGSRHDRDVAELPEACQGGCEHTGVRHYEHLSVARMFPWERHKLTGWKLVPVR